MEQHLLTLLTSGNRDTVQISSFYSHFPDYRLINCHSHASCTFAAHTLTLTLGQIVYMEENDDD